jgi:ribosomal protein L22
MQDIQAKIRFSLSAQKVRYVIDLMRGKNANEALEILRFVNKARCIACAKNWLLLQWPMPKKTSVSAATTCMLPRSQRTKLRLASGDALALVAVSSRLLRRTSHVTVILRERGA